MNILNEVTGDITALEHRLGVAIETGILLADTRLKLSRLIVIATDEAAKQRFQTALDTLG